MDVKNHRRRRKKDDRFSKRKWRGEGGPFLGSKRKKNSLRKGVRDQALGTDNTPEASREGIVCTCPD